MIKNVEKTILRVKPGKTMMLEGNVYDGPCDVILETAVPADLYEHYHERFLQETGGTFDLVIQDTMGVEGVLPTPEPPHFSKRKGRKKKGGADIGDM